MIPANTNPLLLAGDSGYRIERSLRTRASVSGYLSRTPASAGNRKTWTFSTWVKRGDIAKASTPSLFNCYSGSDNTNFLEISFNPSEQLIINGWTANYRTSVMLFRDPAAMYHIKVSLDTTQALEADRCVIQVNGKVIATTSGNAIPQNADLGIGQAALHNIAARNNNSQFMDAVHADIYYVGGVALPASSFGEFDPNGNWNPKRYTGIYGADGFHLEFKDNSAATASTIGKDTSGNGNNWTPTNISVTTGVTNDSLIDTPTNYDDSGNGRGNYATLNPLKMRGGSLADGNLRLVGGTGGATGMVAATMPFDPSGKWYVETASSGTSASVDFAIGLMNSAVNTLAIHANPGMDFYVSDTKYITVNGTAIYTTGGTLVSTDIVKLAIDATTGKMWIGVNAGWYSSTGALTGDPATGANPTTILSTAIIWEMYLIAVSGNPMAYANFGQRPFVYAPPAGFKSLNTQNLPTPIIPNPKAYVAATLYSGTGVAQSIVNAGKFQPDFLIGAARNIVLDNNAFDSARGPTKRISTNLALSEDTISGVTSFDASGFTIGPHGSLNSVAAYVAWQWKKGTIPGFDIVLYKGTAASRSIAHSLGAVPSMKIIKGRSAAHDWINNHKGIPPTSYMVLNSTAAAVSNANLFSGGDTSAVFNLGAGATGINTTDVDYVAYLWAEVPGFSKFGTYTGNGLPEGPFVGCGFSIGLLLVKRADGTGPWQFKDSSRNPFNMADLTLFLNLTNAESTTFYFYDLVSNGFKVRGTDAELNASGGTYIYMAFAENPFKTARAR